MPLDDSLELSFVMEFNRHGHRQAFNSIVVNGDKKEPVLTGIGRSESFKLGQRRRASYANKLIGSKISAK